MIAGVKLLSRYTRVDKDQINYDITMEDPNVLTKPWVHANLMLWEAANTRSFLIVHLK